MQKISLKIDDSLYDSNLIDKAILDFKDIVKIEYLNSVIVIYNDTDYLEHELYWEFMNYVIWLKNETL